MSTCGEINLLPGAVSAPSSKTKDMFFIAHPDLSSKLINLPSTVFLDPNYHLRHTQIEIDPPSPLYTGLVPFLLTTRHSHSHSLNCIFMSYQYSSTGTFSSPFPYMPGSPQPGVPFPRHPQKPGSMPPHPEMPPRPEHFPHPGSYRSPTGESSVSYRRLDSLILHCTVDLLTVSFPSIIS